MEKLNIVDIGQINELPEQPDLIKKMKEEKEKNIGDEESLKIFEKYPQIYKNVNDKEFIRVRRIIKKKKKNK